MRSFFVFSNIKVNTFLPSDRPLPGFRLITYESESWVEGTLLDLGRDAGYTPIGHTQVFGQIWYAEEPDSVDLLLDMVGIKSGMNELFEVPVYTVSDDTLNAFTYRLTTIPHGSDIVRDGKWTIKRS